MRYALSVLILGAFWVLLGGHGVIGHHGVVAVHDGHVQVRFVFPAVLFVFSMVVCGLLGGRLFFPGGAVGPGLRVTGRFLLYLPWLVWQIAKSNWDLIYRTLHPDLPIAPRVVRFRTGITTDVGHTILANSITLTPGTVTIEIADGEYLVHCIAKEPADGLLAGDMQRRCEWVETGRWPGAPAAPGAAPGAPA